MKTWLENKNGNFVVRLSPLERFFLEKSVGAIEDAPETEEHLKQAVRFSDEEGKATVNKSLNDAKQGEKEYGKVVDSFQTKKKKKRTK